MKGVPLVMDNRRNYSE